MKTKILSIVISFTTIISFVLCEVVLRELQYSRIDNFWVKIFHTIDNQKTELYFEFSDTRIYSANPNIHFNETDWTDQFGFSYSPYHPLKTETTSSIVAIGDSFTHGYGVPAQDAYPSRMEKILNENDKNVLVYNAGVMGYGADQEFEYMKELIPQHRPNVILWNVHMNDIGDSNDFCLYKQTPFGFVRVPVWFNNLYIRAKLNRYVPHFVQNLRLYSLFYNLLIVIPGNERYTFGCSRISKMPYDVYLDDYIQKMNFFISYLSKYFPDTKLIIVLVPFRSYFENLPQGMESKYLAVYPRFVKYLSNLQIPFVDTNQLLASNSSVLQFNKNIEAVTKIFLNNDGFSFDDTHLNTVGYNLLAEIVARFLSSNDIINSQK